MKKLFMVFEIALLSVNIDSFSNKAICSLINELWFYGFPEGCPLHYLRLNVHNIVFLFSLKGLHFSSSEI